MVSINYNHQKIQFYLSDIKVKKITKIKYETKRLTKIKYESKRLIKVKYTSKRLNKGVNNKIYRLK